MNQAQSFLFPFRVEVPPRHWDGELAADLFAAEGTPVLAVFDGVSRAADFPLGGYTVILTADDGTEAYYAHLFPNRVSGRVTAGQTIGYCDRSGNAAGTPPHVHFAIGTINNAGGGTIPPIDFFREAEPPLPWPVPIPLPAVSGVGAALVGLLLVAVGAGVYYYNRRR